MAKSPAPVEPISGFRDTPSGMSQVRQDMLATIRRVYESFGFVPLDTPAIEDWRILTAKTGPETRQQIYRVNHSSGRDMGLRFDLTVPLCRYVAWALARNNQKMIPLPFRRYQMQPVWRGDKPQEGRYREFWQCDVDIVGSDSMLSDAECILIDIAVLQALGIERFQIKVNNRKLLNAMAAWAGVPDNQIMRTFRALDKLAKIGPEGVRVELLTEERSEEWDEVAKVHKDLPPLPEDVIDKVLEFAALTGSNQEILTKLQTMLKDSDLGAEALDELMEVFQILQTCGTNMGLVQLDPSIVRGMDYYTGTIFETSLTDLPEIGSVMSGGRFDKLIGMFLGRDIPGVGISLGLDRLIAAMDKMGMIKTTYATAQVLITQMDASHRLEYLKWATQLRQAGINTEVYYKRRAIRHQFGYASMCGVPIVVIAGGNEMSKGVVNVKDMRTSQQSEVTVENLVPRILEMLG